MTIIALLYHGMQVVIYYFPERAWERVPWGQMRHPLATIPVKRELAPEDMEIVVERLRNMGYVG